MLEVLRLTLMAAQIQQTPYLYGGNNPLEGFDCSGFVSWGLRRVGAVPYHSDFNSQQLFNLFERDGSWNIYKFGSLAFFGESVTKITHVAFIWNEHFVLECGGGDSTTVTREIAAKKGACVRFSNLKFRSDLVAVIRPRVLP